MQRNNATLIKLYIHIYNFAEPIPHKDILCGIGSASHHKGYVGVLYRDYNLPVIDGYWTPDIWLALANGNIAA